MIMKITLFTGKTSNLQNKIKNELGLDISVTKRALTKKLTIRIDGRSKIPNVSIPTYCSDKKAFCFIESNLPWILEKLSQIPNQEKFENGSSITLFGQALTIRHKPELKAGVFIDKDELIVCGSQDFIHRRVKDFCKAFAKNKLYEISKFKANLINCSLNKVVIKDTKSRWGSCSSNNNINYNWRISLAPDFVIDYLTSHEVSHLKHQDHSKNFWNCVKSLSPNFEQGRDWLKNHGRELNIYE